MQDGTIGLEVGDRIPLHLGTEKRYGVLQPRLWVAFGPIPIIDDQAIEVESHAAAVALVKSHHPHAHIDSYGSNEITGAFIPSTTASPDEVVILAGFYESDAAVIHEELGLRDDAIFYGAGAIHWLCRLDPPDWP